MALNICLTLLVLTSSSALIECQQQQQSQSVKVNDFGLQLVQSLQQNDDQNVLLSPLAVYRSLLLLLVDGGAKEQTEEELRHFLNLNKQDDLKAVQTESEQLVEKIVNKNGEDQELSLLVRLLVNRKGIQSLKETFKRAVKEEVTKALVEEVDLSLNAKQVTQDVNEWLRNGTRGRLTRFFKDDLDSTSQSMIMLSASDFTGKMKLNLSQSEERKEFSNFVTNSVPFFKQMVPYLESSVQKLRLITSEELKSQLLEIPYEKNISLIIVQPNDLEALQQLNENLTSVQLTSALNQVLSEEPKPLKVNLPKFKVDFDLELKDIVEDFDVKTLFNTSAQFKDNGVTSGQRLTQSVHKASFEVKPNTNTIVEPSVGISEEFSVEKPFLFILRDNELKANLLLGKVNHLVDEEALGLGFI